MKKAMVILFLVLKEYTVLYAQPSLMTFESLSIQNGFPSAQVWSILRDSKGFLWLGSVDGLIRYDGVNYQMYYPNKDDSTQLFEGFIHHLFEDSQGRIWLSAGVVPNSQIVQVFNPNTEKFSRFNFTVSINANKSNKFDAQNYFLEDENGDIWIKSRYSGIYRIEEKSSSQFSVTNYKVPFENIEDMTGGDIHVLFLDRRKILWVGTKNGLYQFDRVREKFIKFPENIDGNPDHAIGIAEDTKGNLWVNYERRGLYILDPETKNFSVKWPVSNHTVGAFNDRYIVLDTHENLWMLKQNEQGEHTSLDRFNSNTSKIKRYFENQAGGPKIIFQIDSLGQAWVLRDDRLYRYNSMRDGFDLMHIFATSVAYFKVDSHQNIWVSNPSDGLLKHQYSNNKVKVLSSDFLFYNFPWRSTCLESDSVSILMANHEGVIRFELNDKQEVVSRELVVEGRYCYNLTQDKYGNIWAPCFNDGKVEINQIYSDSYEVNTIRLPQNDHANPKNNKNLDPESFDISHFQLPTNNDYTVNSIAQIDDQKIVITTMFNGIFLLNQKTGDFTHFSSNSKDATSISSDILNHVVTDDQNKTWLFNRIGVDYVDADKRRITNVYDKLLENLGYILDIHEYESGLFWLAGVYGLVLFEPATGQIHKTYLAREGFPTKDIRVIVSDDKGDLWLGTETGLVYFQIQENQFKKFDTSDGLPSNRVYAGTKRKSGELVFGGDKGIFTFHPDDLPLNRYPPNPVFTEFRLFNNKITIDEEILDESISRTNEVILSYDQNVLSFSYSALSFANPSKNQYAYYMEGVDRDWNYVGNQTFASYAGLPPGDYVFQLKASNNDGLWNETPTQLAITILPPWWRTVWAYLIYSILLLSILYTAYRIQIYRKLEKAEAQRLHDLDVFKSRFYTNITHEFRTPLTVVLGITEQLEQQFQSARSLTRLVRRNALSLLQLVNQMLDLSKLEAGMLRVNLQQGDVIPYVRYIVESFHSLAEQKDMLLHFRTEVPELLMDYDAEKTLSIVTNLLSNAIKFTPQGGHISLVISEIREGNSAKLQIRVADTGMGIPADQLPHIFSRFYQADNSTTRREEGTGVGLALTQEIVRLLGGDIRVKSTLWQGSEFTVEIPITNTALVEGELPVISPSVPAFSEGEEADRTMTTDERRKHPVALIVEDNMDVVYYLRTCLHRDYTLEVAQNGQDGIDKARSLLPDIIISDVMMPEKNGYELCRILKADMATSHIPIILLTAKAAEEDKLEGLEMGADAYLTKPFNQQELRLRLRNLIRQRRKLWQQYREADPYPPQELEINSADQRFLHRAWAILEEHKSDPDFRTEHLLRELGVSRTLLHVKLKALTGQSATAFIRTYRLKYAAQLIKQQYGNMAQVAFESGFNDQSYFTRSFRKHFGVPPSEYSDRLS